MWGAIIGAVIALVSTLITSNQQETSNQHAAQWQLDAQNQLIDKQNAYNSPESQMRRYQNAGMNPHLIYGQGGPGNQSSSGNAPTMLPKDFSGLMGIGGAAESGLLAQSQVQAQNAATEQKTTQASLNRLQARVIEKNPLLDTEGFKAIIDGLKTTADIKRTELTKNRQSIYLTQQFGTGKAEQEIKALEQKYKLMKVDEKIKAEILNSKEFRNDMDEVMKKFLVDGQVGPQQIYQFILLLLNKSL